MVRRWISCTRASEGMHAQDSGRHKFIFLLEMIDACAWNCWCYRALTFRPKFDYVQCACVCVWICRSVVGTSQWYPPFTWYRVRQKGEHNEIYFYRSRSQEDKKHTHQDQIQSLLHNVSKSKTTDVIVRLRYYYYYYFTYVTLNAHTMKLYWFQHITDHNKFEFFISIFRLILLYNRKLIANVYVERIHGGAHATKVVNVIALLWPFVENNLPKWPCTGQGQQIFIHFSLFLFRIFSSFHFFLWTK